MKGSSPCLQVARPNPILGVPRAHGNQTVEMPAVCSLDLQAASRKRLAISSGCGVSHDFDGGGLTFVAHCAVRNRKKLNFQRSFFVCAGEASGRKTGRLTRILLCLSPLLTRLFLLRLCMSEQSCRSLRVTGFVRQARAFYSPKLN